MWVFCVCSHALSLPLCTCGHADCRHTRGISTPSLSQPSLALTKTLTGVCVCLCVCVLGGGCIGVCACWCVHGSVHVHVHVHVRMYAVPTLCLRWRGVECVVLNGARRQTCGGLPLAASCRCCLLRADCTCACMECSIRQKTTENKGEIDKIETEVASRPAVEEPGVLVRAWWLVRTVLMLLASAHAVFSIHQAAVHPATVHPSPSLASFPFLTSAAAPAPAYPTELGEEDSQPSCLEHPAGAQSRDNVQRSAREAGGDREEAGGDRARSDQAPLLSNIVAGGEVELLAMVGEDQHTSVQDGAHAGAREGHEEMEDGKDVGMLYPGPQSTVLCLCVSLSLCLSLRLRLFCVRLSVLCLSLCLCVCLFLYLGPASHLALGAKTAQSLRNFILQLQNTSLLSGDGRAR